MRPGAVPILARTLGLLAAPLAAYRFRLEQLRLIGWRLFAGW